MRNNTKTIIAEAFSALLHPLMMPLYLGILYLFVPPFSYHTVPNNRLIYLCCISLFFQVLPVIILYILKRQGTITSIHLDAHRERFVPMVGIFLSFFSGLFVLQKLMAPAVLILMLKGVCIAILIVASISIFWKISAHMTGVGGALAIIIILSISARTNLSNWAFIISLYAGILGWARLHLNHHDKPQIYSGFAVGFLSVLASFVIAL